MSFSAKEISEFSHRIIAEKGDYKDNTTIIAEKGDYKDNTTL